MFEHAAEVLFVGGIVDPTGFERFSSPHETKEFSKTEAVQHSII